MTIRFRGEQAPHWVLGIPSESSIVPVGRVFSKYRYIPGPGKADDFDRLSLTMQGVLPRSREADDGLQPENFDGYQLVLSGQLVFKLIDLENVATSRVGLSPADGLVSPAYIVVQSTDRVLPEYAYWYFTDLYNRQIFNQLGADGVRSSLGWEGLKELPFILPIKEKQAQIVRFLDERTAKIDELIHKQEKLIDLAGERLSMLGEHLAWGVPLDGAARHGNPLVSPPDGWSLVKNKALLSHVDFRSETGIEELLSVSHITGVTPRSMKNVNMFEAESTVGYRLVDIGDLTINTMWAWMGALGVSGYAGIVSPSYDVYRFRDPDQINGHYFDLAYRTQTYVDLMGANSRGIWKSRLRLYPWIFLSLPMAVPPLAEQNAIVREYNEAEDETKQIIERSQKAISLAQERRSALITAAVTGQIEV